MQGMSSAFLQIEELQEDLPEEIGFFVWNLKVHGEMVHVCKTFYLHTLDVKEDEVRTSLAKLTEEVTMMAEEQGKHSKHQKISDTIREGIRAHVNSFPRVESHYTREQTKREYLESDFNLATMYRLYIEDCKKNSKPFAKKWGYEKIFNYEINIGFFKPKKDQCNFCTQYQNSSEEDKGEMQEKFKEHQDNKERSRKEQDLTNKKPRMTQPNYVGCIIYRKSSIFPMDKHPYFIIKESWQFTTLQFLILEQQRDTVFLGMKELLAEDQMK